MTEALAYLTTLALFSLVIVATARMRHDMLLLACIPPVFVAMVMGFTMAIYSEDAFGAVPTGIAIAVGVPPAWWLSKRLTNRDLLISIYLTWAVAMVLALVALSFPDHA
jgi:hypothetical protein